MAGQELFSGVTVSLFLEEFSILGSRVSPEDALPSVGRHHAVHRGPGSNKDCRRLNWVSPS